MPVLWLRFLRTLGWTVGAADVRNRMRTIRLESRWRKRRTMRNFSARHAEWVTISQCKGLE
jgi:hypothetical protein